MAGWRLFSIFIPIQEKMNMGTRLKGTSFKRLPFCLVATQESLATELVALQPVCINSNIAGE